MDNISIRYSPRRRFECATQCHTLKTPLGRLLAAKYKTSCGSGCIQHLWRVVPVCLKAKPASNFQCQSSDHDFGPQQLCNTLMVSPAAAAMGTPVFAENSTPCVLLISKVSSRALVGYIGMSGGTSSGPCRFMTLSRCCKSGMRCPRQIGPGACQPLKS